MKTVSYITLIHGILLLFNAITNITKEFKYDISSVTNMQYPYLIYGAYLVIAVAFIIAGIGSLRKGKYSYFLSLVLYIMVQLAIILEVEFIISDKFIFGILFFGILGLVGYSYLLFYILKHKNYYE